MHEYDIKLPQHDTLLCKKRDNDKFLIEAFQAAGFHKKELEN